ncbi:hypothetical protein ACFPRL_22965 [Pseudoclavibacter helvolus]
MLILVHLCWLGLARLCRGQYEDHEDKQAEPSGDVVCEGAHGDGRRRHRHVDVAVEDATSQHDHKCDE